MNKYEYQQSYAVNSIRKINEQIKFFNIGNAKTVNRVKPQCDYDCIYVIDNNETEQNVNNFLNENNINVTCDFMGLIKKDNWECYKFNVKINDIEFEYFQGTGHTKAVKRANSSIAGYIYPTIPTATRILYSLVLDSYAMDYTFNDWCDNFGYDSDSIKALKIYNGCIENYKKLACVFSPKQIEQLQELVQEY